MDLTISGRCALVLVSPEFLRSGLGFIFDAGLSVAGSIATPERFGPVVGLVLAGDALPEVCGEPGPLKEVRITLTTEAYGEQRLVKVSYITLTGRTFLDLSADPVSTVRRMPLEAGDVVVVKSDQVLSTAAGDFIRAGIAKLLPDGVGVVLLDRGFDCEVLGKAG